jgi:hypothetical protein
MGDEGEYLDSLSKALIRHKYLKKFGRFGRLLGGGRWGTSADWLYSGWEA